MDPHKNSANHTIEVTGGVPLAPGEVADVDTDEPEMVSAIEEGHLIPMPDEAMAALKQQRQETADREAAEEAERASASATAEAAKPSGTDSKTEETTTGKGGKSE